MKSLVVMFCLVSAEFTTGRAEQARSIEFLAKDAKLTSAGGIKFEARPDQQNIGAWNNTNAVVSWSAAEIPKGTYRVIAVFACNGDHPGSEFEVTVGSQRAAFTVTSTGGWTKFQEADLGPVMIRKAGPAEINARVTRITRLYGINLRAIKLVPAP